jgi:DNA polymerase-1
MRRDDLPMHNIPIRTELGRQIRRGFLPASGQSFISFDYSGFELKMAAIYAEELKKR